MAERLLIVEDEDTLRESLKRVLLREGYAVDVVDSAEAAIEKIDEGFYDLIITDIILPGITGIELLRKVKEKLAEQIVIIMTAYASLETAVEALRSGAYDYVVKPVMHEEIKQIVKNALRQGALLEENIFLRKQLARQYDLSRIIGDSPIMKKVISEVKAVAGSKQHVLLLGETGTGKELMARAIHLNSAAAEKPFIPINLHAFPAGSAEMKLFGYVKGAFTEALTPKKGLFEKANGGTVFIREIAGLGPALQSDLLRVFEDSVIRPVGGKQDIPVDLRFISSTNMDIEAAVRAGMFSEKLFRLMSAVTLELPPLRERKEDLRQLVQFFIRKYSDDLCKDIRDIDDAAISCLEQYNWPGNVRELQNIIEHAVLVSDAATLKVEHLPQIFQAR